MRVRATHDRDEDPSTTTSRRAALLATATATATATASASALPAWAWPPKKSKVKAAPLRPPLSTNELSLAARLNLGQQVKEFTLANGIRVLVLERSDGLPAGMAPAQSLRKKEPLVSCCSYVDAGAWEDATGRTGTANLLQKMAFSGTSTVGTTDPDKEANLLEAIDEAFYALREAVKEKRGATEVCR